MILTTLTAFIAFTAIAGGIALVAGLEDFPMEWLANTPFESYTIPGLILILIVGGSNLLAFALLLSKNKNSAIFSLIGGLCIIGEIITELVILDDGEMRPHWIQFFYLTLGILTVVFGYIYMQTED
jgi:hypothetical protein